MLTRRSSVCGVWCGGGAGTSGMGGAEAGAEAGGGPGGGPGGGVAGAGGKSCAGRSGPWPYCICCRPPEVGQK
ncbi:hypothetical protein Shyhy01_62480 [Streptomyces hygroscopicus subsp. hygroscopicus]|nr:hypothetical protein Shyhy01_62480 [Streptomyces hygroscopicus subsp. hygroscopicus]